jgi:hypothetical protein
VNLINGINIGHVSVIIYTTCIHENFRKSKKKCVDVVIMHFLAIE